jgi:fluoride ion exporter CrcB/FEX
LGGLGTLLVTPSLGYCAFWAGESLGRFNGIREHVALEHIVEEEPESMVPSTEAIEEESPKEFVPLANRFIIYSITAAYSIVLIVGVIVWALDVQATALSDLWAPLVFGPLGAFLTPTAKQFMYTLGTLLRWQLSLKLNQTNPVVSLRSFWSIVRGTLSSNLLGTLILGVIFTITSLYNLNYSQNLVMKGVADGFCGCLTTLSTWIAESTRVLSRKSGASYALVSVTFAQLLLIVSVGIPHWTR